MCAPADQLETELLKRLRIVEVPSIFQYLFQLRSAAFEFAGRGVRRQHPRQHPGAAFTPRLLRRRQRIRECRQHLFADFSGERLDYRSRRGNYVPVRNLSRTNSRRPFSRKCVPPNRIKGSLFSLQSEQRIGESAAICGGGRGIRNIVNVCSVMYLRVESGIENRNITERHPLLGNSSYSQNSPFLSTFSTPANPRRFVTIMIEQAISPTP